MNFLSIESNVTYMDSTFTDEELVTLGNFIANNVSKESNSDKVANRLLHLLRQWEDETL